MKRRQFVKVTGYGLTGWALFPSLTFGENHPHAVVVRNGEPEELLHAALQAFGGLQRFIRPGDVVVIKPNIGWDRPPELAATTNPDLIHALVKACYRAGAKKVRLFDRTCNTARRCYRHSGIAEKAKQAGADVSYIRRNRFKEIPINGKLVKSWPIYRDYLEADKVINVPIAKHHSLSRVTLGLKNLMGVMGGDRGQIHNFFDIKLNEIDRHILPTLTIVDAYRILTANGPQGGSPDYVKKARTLIVSDCTVTADYLALELFNLKLNEVGHIRQAVEMGLAKYDINKLNVRRIDLT